MLIKLPDKSQVGKPGLVLATPGWYTEAEGLLQGQPGPPVTCLKSTALQILGSCQGLSKKLHWAKGTSQGPILWSTAALHLETQRLTLEQ